MDMSEFWATLFEDMPLCLFEVDFSVVPARILDANHRAESTYGWSREELRTMPLDSIVSPEARSGIGQFAERVRVEHTVTITTAHRRRAGAIFPVRMIAVAAKDAQTDRVIIAVENIADEKACQSEAKAIDDERRRIAQEIHDGVTQDLAALRLRASLWPDFLQTDPTRLLSEIDDLQVILDSAIVQMRRILCALRPLALDEVGLFPALRRLIDDFEGQHRVNVGFRISGSEDRVPAELELPIFRVVQEALNNVAKHAQAHRVQLSFDLSHTDVIVLDIADNGRGFEDSSLDSAARAGHLGLKQMRERVRKARGRLSITSRPGQGTKLQVRFPRDSSSEVGDGSHQSASG